MNEFVSVTADWFRDDLGVPAGDDDPRDRQHEYIIGPEPYPDDPFDVGTGD